MVALQLGLPRKAIRAFSYAALFYKHVRCGLVHEFHVTEDATWNPMTTQNAGVSYSNRGTAADVFAIKRLIYFDVTWLANILRSIVDRFGDAGPMRRAAPGVWWVDEAGT